MRQRRAVLLGVGGLGSPAALALAEELRGAQGEPALELVLVDDDRVEPSNLSRQILFRDADRGRLKVEAAAEALHRLAPGTALRLVPRPLRFDEASARELLAGADVLLDGTDSFATRFLANDRARAANIPLVHGAVLGWAGQLLTALPGVGGCLRCFFEGPPPEGTVPACSEAGVASPLCGLVGAAMAGEALRILRGQVPLAASRLLRWNGFEGVLRTSAVRRDPACPACAAASAAASTLSLFQGAPTCPSS